MAPELAESATPDKAVDWWALGVLLYWMLVGRAPWPASQGAASGPASHADALDVCLPASLSKPAASLLRGLLERDPKCRLGCTQPDERDVLEHAFFKSIEWTTLNSPSPSPKKSRKKSKSIVPSDPMSTPFDGWI